jgi:hypothetical protein
MCEPFPIPQCAQAKTTQHWLLGKKKCHAKRSHLSNCRRTVAISVGRVVVGFAIGIAHWVLRFFGLKKKTKNKRLKLIENGEIIKIINFSIID